MKMPDEFYIPEGYKVEISKDSCDGCAFDERDNKKVGYTCSYSKVAEPIIAKVPRNIWSPKRLEFVTIEREEYLKRYPNCSRGDSPVRKPFIYIKA